MAEITISAQPNSSSHDDDDDDDDQADTHQQEDSDQLIQVDQIPQENTSPDHSERKVPAPCSKATTRGAYCLSKTLTSIEAVQENPKLYFDPYDASILTGCPEMRRRPLGKYSKDLLIFDGNNTEYTMNLSHCVSGGEIRSYCLNTDWNRFLRTHNLKEGDVLTFYRFFDKSVSEECYYVVKYFRKLAVADVGDQCKGKPSDCAGEIDKHDESTELKVCKIQQKNTILLSKKKESKVRGSEALLKNACDRRKKNAQGPGSRALTRESYCLSKTLSTFEVAREGNARLYFDAYEASRLTGCPEILDDDPLRALLKGVLVFDADNRQYDMMLSHFKTDYGEIIYTLDCGWQRFVRVHDLKAGDEIFVYRIQDQSVYDECYYVIKYTGKPTGR